ncbi:membrane fusion protein (multidrug efflux system) [Pseudorhizobium tarimense]|uniref:Membrane fusion protein (Multidrug efflux system) n=1 Tax=Pseudorhizobium tarimense TaxID=1079109 RepID=A0ABV2H4T5_9HYPH|nr:efflux RND transporter periplasmic adaptor subunit [Pseudorhizobium tarimense]MCJ8518793.1 efflux RND transporter periplasmic adaptor subunit [Pseudorhizobium tarimense]
MIRLKILVPTLLSVALASCSDSGGGAGTGQASQAQERPPTPVSVVSMEKGQFPITRVLPGRATAFRTAEIRPRVTGSIREIAFKEGSEVKEGDLLFQIEDDTYQAALAEARASVAKAEASVPSAEANLARYERLVNSGATQIDYENARVTFLQAQADVAQAKAALKTAEINLDLTKIRAPFDGITSISNVAIGNIVTANQAEALTTLRQLDPIYIDLTESSTNLLELRTAFESGRLSGDPRNAEISLTLEDGTVYPQKGKLDMAEMAVSESTGTYQIRALFDNPNDVILPGMYVRATVTLGEENGYLIPQRAATRNARGELSAKFVTADNKVETRIFPTSQVSGNNWLVAEGVADGDRLVVDGFQWIGDGATVAPVDSTVDDDGLVVQTQQGGSASEQAPQQQ